MPSVKVKINGQWVPVVAGPHTHDAASIVKGTLNAKRLPVVPVEKGGTGAATAADARVNLGITPGNIGAAPASHKHTAADVGAAPAYTYGTADLTAGVSSLETGKLYFVYE